MFTVLDNGYVGIGTSSPEYNLDVVGTVRFGSDTAGDIIFDTTTITTPVLVGIGTSTPDADLTIVSDQTTANTYLFTIATSTSGSHTVDRKFIVDSDGDVWADGSFGSPAADYAEYFNTVDTDLESGEVVCVDVTKENAVKRCQRVADGNVMGIVSTDPAIVGNAKQEYENNENYIIVGMLGQVPAKASTENGGIRPGDSLTSAIEPGYIARANPGDPTVGIALEKLMPENASTTETGIIKVLISRRNKSLTVEMVESQITERIANMEIEDEVAIMLETAIENYNITDSVTPIINEQIAMFDSVLTVEFDNVNNELLLIANSLDDCLARVSALEFGLGEIDHRISTLEGLGSAILEPSLNPVYAITEEGNIVFSNDENYKQTKETGTSTPDVAIVEIYSGTTTDKTALVVNQEGLGDVADFQSGGVSIVNIAQGGEVAVVGEMSIDGRLMVCSGAGCGEALDLAVDETLGDMGVEGTVVAGAFAGYCEDGYIWVPGSSKYGTIPGFCVNEEEMRYEFTDELMVNMTQGEAMLTCEAIGDGYHLISENEWLTIAENIIRVVDNDVDEVLDGLQLASAKIAVETQNFASASTSSIEFILSNENIIYDFVGGVSEWTDQTITTASVFEPQAETWQEYFEIDNYQGFNVAPPYYYTSENNIGRILTGTASSSEQKFLLPTNDYLRAFVRGENALFDLDLSHSPVEATSTIGFRCAK